MSRKLMLAGGVLLSIVYSLLFVCAVALGLATAIYYLMPDSMTIVNELIIPILAPYFYFGKSNLVPVAICAIVLSVFALVLSTRLIKYSSFTKKEFSERKIFSILSVVFFVMSLLFVTFLAVKNINFEKNLISSILYVLIISIHLVSIVFFIVDIILEPKYFETAIALDKKENKLKQEEINVNENYVKPKEIIDEVAKEEKQEEKENYPLIKPKMEDDPSSQKLVEGIAKLDAMKKEGNLSDEEYRKMRSQLIKKFVK